ncbi:hypothetical protein TGARI_361960 [Toxoplasma gondii ARI]|uniref:Uncharacterized protein n=1 Tax=Toxoplasma gondii ARI TaxID=1074872 RepID=A0A139Y6Z5_TOXGO|nr:hypothetical protein TGARI_361960 [Toxoplasma gondii ARI]
MVHPYTTKREAHCFPSLHPHVLRACSLRRMSTSCVVSFQNSRACRRVSSTTANPSRRLAPARSSPAPLCSLLPLLSVSSPLTSPSSTWVSFGRRKSPSSAAAPSFTGPWAAARCRAALEFPSPAQCHREPRGPRLGLLRPAGCGGALNRATWVAARMTEGMNGQRHRASNFRSSCAASLKEREALCNCILVTGGTVDPGDKGVEPQAKGGDLEEATGAAEVAAVVATELDDAGEDSQE